MRVWTWLLVLLTAAVAWGVWRVVTADSETSPERLVASAFERWRRPEPDHVGALRELDLAIDLARRLGDEQVHARVLLARATFLESRGAFREARADVERALQLGAEPVSEIHLRLAVLGMLANEHDRALDFAARTLAVAPFHPGAHAVRGRVRSAMGEEHLARVRRIADEELPGDDVSRLLAIADLIAARGPDGEGRAALWLDLTKILPRPDSAASEALRAEVEAATRAFAEARESYRASLRLHVRADAVLGLLDLDIRARRYADAADFALAALVHDEPYRDIRVIERAALALSECGRRRAATALLLDAVRTGRFVTPQFLPTWCRILYDAEAWDQLFQVSTDLSNRTPDVPELRDLRAAADYFRGTAALHLGRRAAAQASLNRFVSRAATDPAPDARGRAWGWLAILERIRDDPIGERRALDQATLHAPDLSGESWLRLAELSRDSSETTPEARMLQWTNVIRLLPERAEEFFADWTNAGRRLVEDQARDLERTFSELERNRRYVPSGKSSPYELWVYAEAWRVRDNWWGVAAACRALLDDHPRFLPAVDLLARAYAETGRHAERAALLLDRVEHIPGSEGALAELRELHASGELGSEHVLALMRIDPGHTGVLAIAKDLLAAERPSVALHGLLRAGTESLGDEGRLLIAKCRVELGDPRGAIDALADIVPGSPTRTRALALAVEAALAIPDLDLLDRLVAEAAEETDLEKAAVLALVDTLIARGEWHPAWTLLHGLDAHRHQRGGDVTVRIAIAAIVAGEHAAAREALERTRALEGDASAGLGRLVLAARQNRWSQLPNIAHELRLATRETTPLGAVLLAALEERDDFARELLLSDREAVESDPRWPLARLALDSIARRPVEPAAALGAAAADETKAFLGGSPERRRDPRFALVQLLAFERPEWTRWVIADLDAGGADGGTLWPRYLTALAEHTVGERSLLRRRLLLLTAEFPDFEPGWSLFSRVEEERLDRPDHPQLLALRARRRAALGQEGDPSQHVDALVHRAGELGARGDDARALELARLAVQLAPTDAAARLALATAAARAKKSAEAVENYLLHFARTGRGSGYDAIPALLASLDVALFTGEIPPEAAARALDKIAPVRPDDPAIALARARLEIARRPDAPTVALGRALDLLDRFRVATKGVPLEYLRSGSTADWVAFLVRHDVERADRFSADELARNPTSVEVWLARGRALEATGRGAEALLHYDRLRAMVPDPRAALRTAHLLADAGGEIAQVERETERVRIVENRPPDDPELLLIRARARLLDDPPRLDAAVAILSGLWDRRESGALGPHEVDIARAYALAMLRRGLAADTARCTEVAQIGARSARSRADRRFFERLAELAVRLPRQRPGA